MHQLKDLLIVVLPEQQRRPSDAVVEGSTRRLDQQGVELTYRLVVDIGLVLQRVEVVGVVTVGAQGLYGLCEKSFEEITRPLDGVFDLVRVVLQCADRNPLFYALCDALTHTLGVVRRSVTLR